MRSTLRILGCLLLFLVLPQTARAAWYEASSDHFLIYANDSEKDIRQFATELERYHAAMTFLTGGNSRKPSPSNRVTIFVVRSVRDVRELYGDGSRNIGGFYQPRAGGSIAIVPRIKLKRGDLDFSMISLLHEYAHHFMHSRSGFPMPRWYSEGGAEFFASVRFEKDGTVSIGRPANHRAAELFMAREVRAIDLLDPDSYEKSRRSGYDSYYGKSWLLFHLLSNDEGRRGQLNEYLLGMSKGASSIDSARKAFGDLDQLEKDMDRYVRRPITLFNLPPDLLPIGSIAIRQLRAGEAEMMPVVIRSRRGVTEEQAAELLGEAREIAARHPRDPEVLAALAEAEFDAGNPYHAITVADRALALDPKQVKAHVQKGYALFSVAREAKTGHAEAFKRARRPFIELNKLENDHPIPLIYFYRSYVESGATPPKIAVEGLEWASELAPYDVGLKIEVARRQLFEGRLKEARRSLVPVAYNPHGGQAADFARQIIERIDAGETAAGELALPDLSDLDETDE